MLSHDLRAARALIADPKHWGVFAYEDHGRFCAVGAIRKAVTGHTSIDLMSGASYQLYRRVTDYIEDQFLLRNSGGLTGFNDTHEHAEVLALFDRAITKAEQSEPTHE